MSLNILSNKNSFEKTQNIDNIKISDLSKNKQFVDIYNNKCNENIKSRLNIINKLSKKKNSNLYDNKDISIFCNCSLKKLNNYQIKDIKKLSVLDKDSKLKDDIKKCTMETLIFKEKTSKKTPSKKKTSKKTPSKKKKKTSKKKKTPSKKK